MPTGPSPRADSPENLRKCVQGDKQAWDALVDHFAPVIYRTCRKTFARYGVGPGFADAEDATQEVFVRLVKENYRLLKSYDPSRSSLRTWLTIVTRSTTVDLLRRRRAVEVPLDERRADGAVSPSEGPDARLEIPRGVLSVRQSLVLHMLFDRDMDVRDVARLLKIDEQTVRSTKHKALEALRRHFGVKKRE